jgi:hypothetical protein
MPHLKVSNINNMTQLIHLYRYPIIVPRYDGKTPAHRGPLQLYSSRYVTISPCRARCQRPPSWNTRYLPICSICRVLLLEKGANGPSLRILVSAYRGARLMRRTELTNDGSGAGAVDGLPPPTRQHARVQIKNGSGTIHATSGRVERVAM